jgi:hypothetical protein
VDYAHERLAARSLLAFVGRKRMNQVGATPVEPDALESLSMWLFAEELEAGHATIEDNRFEEACELYAAAEQVDDRCHAVAHWYAIALLLLCRNPETSLAECHDLLIRASVRAEVAAEDPERCEVAENIAAVIARDLAQVRLLTGITDLIRRFNTEAANLSAGASGTTTSCTRYGTGSRTSVFRPPRCTASATGGPRRRNSSRS